jgi:threonine aldolase
MRQAGYLAAAGIFALDNNIKRLSEDHRRAKEIGQVLQNLPWIASVEPIETNILIFSVQTYLNEKIITEKLKEKGISISNMGHGKLRIVTHLDYREVMHDYVLETLVKMVV